jgi:hypothetical protein
MYDAGLVETGRYSMQRFCYDKYTGSNDVTFFEFLREEFEDKLESQADTLTNEEFCVSYFITYLKVNLRG